MLAISAILVFVVLYLGYWAANRRKVRKIVQFFGVRFMLWLDCSGDGADGHGFCEQPFVGS